MFTKKSGSKRSVIWCSKKDVWMFTKKFHLMLKKRKFGCSQRSPVWMDVQEEVLFDAQKEVCSKKEDVHKEIWFRYSKRSPAWMFKKRSIQFFFSSSGWTQDERTPHVYRWPFFSLCPLTTTNPPLGSSLSWGGCITISYIYHQIPLIPFAPGSAIILYEA